MLNVAACPSLLLQLSAALPLLFCHFVWIIQRKPDKSVRIWATSAEPAEGGAVMWNVGSWPWRNVQFVVAAGAKFGLNSILSEPRGCQHIRCLSIMLKLLTILWKESIAMYRNLKLCLITLSSLIFYHVQNKKKRHPALFPLLRPFSFSSTRRYMSIKPHWYVEC